MVSSIGSMLEFFDFGLVIVFSPILAQVFFPEQANNILFILYIYTAGTFMRFVGGTILGHLGDRYGRKRVFSLSIFVMALSTLGIALLPGFNDIGYISPVLLILFRLMQGMAVGGELPSALVFMVEHRNKRIGLLSGFLIMAFTFGNVFAMLIGNVLTKIISEESMLSWGWRLPFLSGALLGLIAYYLRKNINETPFFIAIEKEISAKKHKVPFRELILNYRKQCVFGLIVTAVPAISIHLLLSLPFYFYKAFEQSGYGNYQLATWGFTLLAILSLVSGYVSDIMGRKALFITSASILIILSLIYFVLPYCNFVRMLPMFGLLTILAVALVNGIYDCTIVNMFPTQVRLSGLAFCHNIGFAIFGGLTPVIVGHNPHQDIPVILLFVAAIILFTSCIKIPSKTYNYLGNGLNQTFCH